MQDNIKVFIENGLEEEPRKLRSSLLLVNFFPMIGVAYGLLLGNVYRVFSALIVFSITISFIQILVLTKKNTKMRVIKADICFNFFTATNYLLFAMILQTMYNKVHFIFTSHFCGDTDNATYCKGSYKESGSSF